jgi:inner membrane transporter RhtA
VAHHRGRLALLLFGACLAVMNSTFYLAIDRLPLSLVATIEFVATIAVALLGLRSWRNYAALALAVAGVFVLTDLRWASDPLGLAYAVANGLLFVAYILLGHRLARDGAREGVGRLGAAMAIAFVVVMPIGFREAMPAFAEPLLILAGIGVGICSSVIPYVSDQLAMSRLPRSSFALMLALLPATATAIGALVLAQIPTLRDLLGIALVMAGIALHRPPNGVEEEDRKGFTAETQRRRDAEKKVSADERR